MSVKDSCSSHHKHKRRNRFILGGAIAVVLIGLVVLIVFLVLQPRSPTFRLQDVTVNNFTVSTTAPYTITTAMQVTIFTRNPNHRIGINYQKLDAFSTYRDQPITLPTLLPPYYQGHHDVAVWSPVVSGNSVVVSPYVEELLAQDLNVGAALVNFKVDGLLKWKVGTWMSGTYQIHVSCPVYIKFSNPCSTCSQVAAILIHACNVETSLD